MDTSLLTNNGVDINKGLELLGDMDMYNDTLKDFIEESKTRIPNIVKYFNENNMADYAIEVHAMKSDSKYLGFMTLADLAYEHEMASKANETDKVNSKYDELMEEANKIYKIAKEYLGQ